MAPRTNKTGLLLIGLACAAPLPAASVKSETQTEPESSLSRPYAYFANGESLNTVLQNLGRNFGLTVKMKAAFKEPMSGRVGGDTAADMLNRLSEMFGFSWFIFGKTLYISPGTDRIVQRIRVAPGSAESLKQALIDIGLITPRFGWGSVPEEDTVIVTGPREYVNLVTATLAKLESGDSMHTMVFKLKYASVEDRRIQLRDREFVTRGLASILNGLLTRNAKPASGGSGGGTSSPGQPLSPSPGKLSETSGQEGSPRATQTESSRSNSTGPTIESDPRLNAIIIRDHISKQKMYADLIAELDVPTPLVEIEASIIEIDQTKFDEIGTQWKYGSGSFGIESFSSDNLSTGTKGGLNLAFGSGATSVIRDLRGFNATLRLLESNGEAKVLAKPAVLTLDNLGAVLDLTDTSYTSVIGEKVANIVPVTVGTLLRVTPHVILEESRTRIQLAVDIEDGSQQTAAGSSNVRVKKTNISTQAIIEPNQSLLIAGYSLEQESTGNSGIPVLGKLPLLGPLFSTRSNSTKRLKRLFLITPKVMSPDGSVEESSSASSSRQTSIAQSKLPQAPVQAPAVPTAPAASPARSAPPPTQAPSSTRQTASDTPPQPASSTTFEPAKGGVLNGAQSAGDTASGAGISEKVPTERPERATRTAAQTKPISDNAQQAIDGSGVRNRPTYTIPKAVTSESTSLKADGNSTALRSDADFSKSTTSNASKKSAKRTSMRFSTTSETVAR